MNELEMLMGALTAIKKQFPDLPALIVVTAAGATVTDLADPRIVPLLLYRAGRQGERRQGERRLAEEGTAAYRARDVVSPDAPERADLVRLCDAVHAEEDAARAASQFQHHLAATFHMMAAVDANKEWDCACPPCAATRANGRLAHELLTHLRRSRRPGDGASTPPLHVIDMESSNG